MTLLTVRELIIELHMCKARSTTDVVLKLEILNKLELLEENNVDDFTVYLCNLLSDEAIEKQIKKILYKISLVLGKFYPRNRLENGKALDPILFENIDPKYLFISLDRYQWSIVNLVSYFVTQNTYLNPVTNVLFDRIDIEKMKSLAMKVGLTIRLQSEFTPTNNHSGVFDSTIMGNQLYNFFGSSFRMLTVNSNHSNTANSQHRNNTVIVAIPFAGGMAYRG